MPSPKQSSRSLRTFIALPPRGVRLMKASSSPELQSFFEGARNGAGAKRWGRSAGINVLDAIDGNGAKLIEASDEAVLALREQQPGVRLVPVVYYSPAVVRYRVERSHREVVATTIAATKNVAFTVDGSDQKPAVGAMVVAFTDFAQRAGAQGKTNSKGKLTLKVAGKIERLYVYPAKEYWTAELRNLPSKAAFSVTLEAIDFAFKDVLRSFYPNPADTDGSGVTIGVIDTGSGPHPDLTVAGGACTVTGEPASDFNDNGMQHGTHVAGIIAGHAKSGGGMRGIAPSVTLRAYRVFAMPTAKEPEPGASNFAIAKAIDRAIADGCDLINMSLGGGPADPATKSAINDARAAGVAVIVASGNDGRQQISFPAADELAIAVSALGRKGTVPPKTVDALDNIVAPFRTDQTCVAPFSNTGDGVRNIDLIGAGVGIASTVPGGYASMSGTSMACPAVTGAAAKLLGATPAVLNMPRDQARSDAIVRLLFGAARSMGFTVQQEGHGMLP